MISWKWITGLLLLGLAELLLVVKLHQWFDIKMLVVIYLATTLVGFIFHKIMERYIFSKQFAQATYLNKKARRRLDRKIENSQALNEDEQLHYKFVIGTLFFTFALILIVMPGLLTDIIGMIIVIPGLMNKILDKAMVAYNEQALRNSAEIEAKS